MIQVNVRKAAAVGVAAALLLTGCGRDGDASESGQAAGLSDGPAKGTLTVWAQAAEAEALPELLKEFEAANPDVEVEVTALPWDAAHNKYQTAIAGGSAPDIAHMGTTWMGDFAYAFDAAPKEIDTDAFFPGSVQSTEVDGEKYGVPWYVDTRMVYYRTDLAEKAGYKEFPETWEDFKALAKALQDKAGAEYGVGLPAGGADAFQSMLLFPWSNGAELMNEDNTEWTFDTPEMVEALEYYQSFFDEGLADENAATDAGAAEAAFVNGSTPMLFAGPSMIGQLEAVGGKEFAEKYAVATVPAKKSSTSFSGGGNLVVFKDTDNRDAAWKLVQWLTEQETQVKWNRATGDLPSAAEAWDAPELADDPKLAEFGTQLKDTNSPPAVASWTKVSAAADTELEQIVKAGKDPAEAMKALQATADSLGTGD
ncbi:extracellular solute-binding protein [Arthrobacter crusticola]|uniref:Extracellular solute-binding protein n=2 Tax=Arthrobacter crusticola TaxID=2547960 RepID=A0A4R5TSX2_9MICC|nr:sugar ABC transporter substrate-binding protein [Arthrobacter crusticola]TDK23688.1 extracellular solute-binding protein [Arthrobacter crusticola]